MVSCCVSFWFILQTAVSYNWLINSVYGMIANIEEST